MQRGIPLTASLGLFEIAVITLTVLLVSLAAAFYPAHSASRMEPVEALRHI
jgi:ABC-type lipoprotein release transport system permease subunit